jgi:hypothetical protein
VGAAKWLGKLKAIGGSQSDDWNNTLTNQTLNCLIHSKDDEAARRKQNAAIAGLIGISPKDELEGMLAAQLVACHNAAMEAYRRAMLPDQPFEGRHENLNQANKLSRTYATLLETLNRHRGRGQQKVTVEHVHVHEGGQAIVGNVEAPGGGVPSKTKDQPHALDYAPGETMPSTDTVRERVPVARDAERAGAIGGKADMPSGR